MITSMFVKVDMYLWSHSCTTDINAPYVICGNAQSLVASFGSEAILGLPSCGDFNTVPFGS